MSNSMWPEDGERYISIMEAAEVLGISEKAMRQRVTRRQVPFRKYHGRVLIPVGEFAAFLESLPGTRFTPRLEEDKNGKNPELRS